MKKILLTFPVFCVLALSSAFAAQSINANFINSNGEKIGTATLKEMKNGTMIAVDITLPEGGHAIHIHTNGSCDVPDFKTAGGHFNPENHKHGFVNETGFHAGDMPNLYVESTGHIKTEIYTPQLHLSGKDSLHSGAIIIHEKADDYSTDPAGNAGSRIACAVIKQ